MQEQDIFYLILDKNLAHFGIDIKELVKKVTTEASLEIQSQLKLKNITSISFVIGDNYSAKFALGIALDLAQTGFLVNLYCLTRFNKLKDSVALNLSEDLQLLKRENIYVLQDCKAEQIKNDSSFVVCLGEPNSIPSLREREAIKRITHFNPFKINLEYPVKGFSWDLSLSFDYAKTLDAKVFKSEINTNLLGVGPGELEAVVLPNQRTHLAQNCRLALASEKPEEYFAPKQKIWLQDIVSKDLDLKDVKNIFTDADCVLIDLPNLYADLLIKVFKEIYPTYISVEFKSQDRQITVLKKSNITSNYKVVLKDGNVEVSGAEIFTGLKKSAKFKTDKSISDLAIDFAALSKFNHPWISSIGCCVW